MESHLYISECSNLLTILSTYVLQRTEQLIETASAVRQTDLWELRRFIKGEIVTNTKEAEMLSVSISSRYMGN